MSAAPAKGEVDRGTVKIWDRGGFALQRTRGGEKPQWLLIKRREG